MVKKPMRFVALAALLVSACYWLRYPDVMETHLELLDHYSVKLQALADGGYDVAPQDWGEFVYPHERAVEFEQIVAGRYGEEDSLVAFRVVLARYGELIASPDILDGASASDEIAGHRAGIVEAVARTRAALAREAE